MNSKFYYFSDPELNYEYKGDPLAVATVGSKPVNLGYWKEGPDYVGAVEALSTIGVDIAHELGFKQGNGGLAIRN